ncbi:ribosome hibernation-promoting factor, HPF/YfiA family [Robertkochia aurantiaca]|uniref:ribosome hibernation-promoting factor, HPF/YfiA family n=1 Tax=Robertkochia aurantiaca TaxID=2873700 RepID=UPI001CC97EB5|nr:ribosome-associated translation inhibitor RaiA [Robertkochia sp. 3YJGBD-33]
MDVNMQSVNFNVQPQLVQFVQRRMDKMETFYDRVIYSDVYLKLLNTSAKENKIAELKVHVPGDELVVKKQGKSFEEAIDKAADSLQRLLTKRKRKIRPYV